METHYDMLQGLLCGILKNVVEENRFSCLSDEQKRALQLMKKNIDSLLAEGSEQIFARLNPIQSIFCDTRKDHFPAGSPITAPADFVDVQRAVDEISTIRIKLTGSIQDYPQHPIPEEIRIENETDVADFVKFYMEKDVSASIRWLRMRITNAFGGRKLLDEMYDFGAQSMRSFHALFSDFLFLFLNASVNFVTFLRVHYGVKIPDSARNEVKLLITDMVVILKEISTKFMDTACTVIESQSSVIR